MAPISPCQSGRRVIAGDRTAHLSSSLGCVRVYTFLCVLYPALSEWPLWQMWILLHLHNRPQVYCLSSAPSSSSYCDPRLPFTWEYEEWWWASCPKAACGDPGILWRCHATHPKLLGRVKPLTCRQSSSQVLCYTCVCVCAFLCVFVIMSYIWNMNDRGGQCHRGDPLILLPFLKIPHKHAVHTCTLCNTKAHRSTLRIKMLIHSLSFIPPQSYLCTCCFGYTLELPCFYSGPNLSVSLFWISLLNLTVSLLNSWTMNKDPVCLPKALLHSLYFHSHSEHEFITAI